MKFYIGLGGIGCRTLHTYSENDPDRKSKEFFYIDSCDFTFQVQETNEYQITVPGISFEQLCCETSDAIRSVLKYSPER